MTDTDLYLRLSDGRVEEALDGREKKLRAEADRLSWTVRDVIIENDINPDGTMKPASAFKRKKVVTPGGKTEMRVMRDGFRRMLDHISVLGRSVLTEDLDRTVRDPRDLEDLIDACAAKQASARSLSGSLTLTNGGTDSEITMARNMVSFGNLASRATGRRVAGGRERWAGKSYQGGRRPFGFDVAPGTVKYHRNLIVNEDEASIIEQAVNDILDKNISLKSIAADWRAKGVLTVTGLKWSAERVKETILKPAVAGLAVATIRTTDADGKEVKIKELRPAPWPGIITRERWEALKEKLTDPARNVSTGNAPKHLLSGIAFCGICDDGTSVHAAGNNGGCYECDQHRHMRRKAAPVEEEVTRWVIHGLTSMPDLLKPPARKGTNAGKLRDDRRKLADRKKRMAVMYAAGDVDDGDWLAANREIKTRIAQIDAELAVTDAPDPLAEFRNRPAETVWAGLSIARKREIVRTLVIVTFKPSSRRGPLFDPDSVDINWAF
ncbi:MAG: recombinase family protein [Streptosporangiaceae bacterium]